MTSKHNGLGRNYLIGHGIKYNIKRKIGNLLFLTLSPTSVDSIRAALLAAPDPV